MKTLLVLGVLGALAALAASSHAVLIDDFTTGGFNSGYLNDPVDGYSFSTAAAVPGGVRGVRYDKTANPNGEDFRVRVNTAAPMLAFTNGIEVDGVGSVFYGFGVAPDLNDNYSANPLFNLTIIANDLPNVAELTITSSSAGIVKRTINLPTVTSSQMVTFDFTGEAALADVDGIRLEFDFAPSGDFAINRIEAVPEPLSLGALAAGVTLLGLRRRKR